MRWLSRRFFEGLDDVLTASNTAEYAESAVHGDDGAGDEGSGVARQPENRPSQLFGAPEPTHGSLTDDVLGAVGVAAVGVYQDGAVLGGEEEAGGDGVDADAVAVLPGHFDGEPAGEVVDARLGDGVGH